MRIRNYWFSIGFLKNKALWEFYQKNNSDKPWLNQDANKFLEQYLTKSDVMLESGSGRSTLWFAKHCGNLISIEDHKGWYNKVKSLIGESKTSNIDYRFAEVDDENPSESNYIKEIKSLSDNSLDVVLVDGKIRHLVAMAAVDKLKIGGLMIIDDSQRYSFNPLTKSPYNAKKSLNEIPNEWLSFWERSKNWRKIWTSNGVKDTTFLIKTN